jgi:hypothetical protein
LKPDEKRILKAEVERLAKRVCTLKGQNPDRLFYGLPLWVNAIDPSAVGVFAKRNVLFAEFKNAVLEAFDLIEDSERVADGKRGSDE